MKAWLRDISKTALQHGIPGNAFVWRLPRHSGQAVALTFDDGPDPEYTPLFLELLARHGAKATFFLIGERIERYPNIARAIVAAGHEVAGHMYTHREITALDNATLVDELSRTRKILAGVTGVATFLFRPPRGKFDLSSLARVARARYRAVHWSVTHSDYLRDTAQALIARYHYAPLRPRDIALFHDNNRHTLEMLDVILPDIRRSSLSFSTVSSAFPDVGCAGK